MFIIWGPEGPFLFGWLSSLADQVKIFAECVLLVIWGAMDGVDVLGAWVEIVVGLLVRTLLRLLVGCLVDLFMVIGQ